MLPWNPQPLYLILMWYPKMYGLVIRGVAFITDKATNLIPKNFLTKTFRFIPFCSNPLSCKWVPAIAGKLTLWWTGIPSSGQCFNLSYLYAMKQANSGARCLSCCQPYLFQHKVIIFSPEYLLFTFPSLCVFFCLLFMYFWQSLLSLSDLHEVKREDRSQLS